MINCMCLNCIFKWILVYIYLTVKSSPHFELWTYLLCKLSSEVYMLSMYSTPVIADCACKKMDRIQSPFLRGLFSGPDSKIEMTFHIHQKLSIVCQIVTSVYFSSVAQLCLTLWDPKDCSMPGLPVHHQLLEFAQTHVHWVGNAV